MRGPQGWATYSRKARDGGARDGALEAVLPGMDACGSREPVLALQIELLAVARRSSGQG